MRELHTNQIFHLDIKPSNVFVFVDKAFKLGDLGRSIDTSESEHPVHERHLFPGDFTYAPPEIRYPHNFISRDNARHAAELFLLGSLAVYYFLGVGMTEATILKMQEPYRPKLRPTMTYEQALPYWRDAWNKVLTDLESNAGNMCDADIGKKLITLVRELTEPDVELRGTPKLRNSPYQRYSVAPYTGKFSTLTKQAESLLKE